MSGIVVGIDGSANSKHALEWAAREARVHGTSLTVVLAWEVPAGVFGGSGFVAATQELMDDLTTGARERLEGTLADAASSLEGIDVHRSVVQGSAARVLLDAARDADVLVVGTRGRGGFAGLLLGSVSQQCAHHSPCPIVIVPPHSD